MEKLLLRKSRLGRGENIWGWVFIAVPLVGLLLFTFVPVVMSVYVSMVDWTGLTPLSKATFAGFKNFEAIFTGVYQKDFLLSLFNTFVLMLSVPIGMVISLLLAIALNHKIKLSGLFRVIYYIPCVANVVAVTILFNKLFSEYGIINQLLGTFKLPKVEWLYKAGPAKIMLIILLVWKGLGYTTLLYLAGLQGIDTEFYEAARLDGAGAFKVFVKITVPLIAPMTFYILVTGVMSALQLYTEPSIMFPYNFGKGPGDGASTIMVLLYYQYSSLDNMGGAAAIAWILALLIMAVTALQFFVNSRRQRA